tara:strand:- start:159 stop:335 length:177 start_codon:yes stop_codon:yes gene_type:complete
MTNNLKKLDLNENNSFFLLKNNKEIKEITTINRSGRNGPEIRAGGIKRSNTDANSKEL